MSAIARPAFVTRVVSHQDRARAIGDAIDDSRTSFDQHHHDRLSGRFDRFGKFDLRFADRQVGDVARRFTIRTFAEREHNDVDVLRGAALRPRCRPPLPDPSECCLKRPALA